MKKVPVIDVEPQDVIFQWRLQKVRNRARVLRLRKYQQQIAWDRATKEERNQFLRHYGFSLKYNDTTYEGLTTMLQRKWGMWFRNKTGDLL